MDIAVAAIASAVTLIIREVIAGLVQLRGQSTAVEKKERDAFEERMQRYLEEAKADRDQARKDKVEAEQKAMDMFQKNIDCEKNTIRLEARIELLTRLSGISLNDTGTKRTLEAIEQEVTAQKKIDSSKTP